MGAMQLKLILVGVFAEMPPVVNLLEDVFDLSVTSQLCNLTNATYEVMLLVVR